MVLPEADQDGVTPPGEDTDQGARSAAGPEPEGRVRRRHRVRRRRRSSGLPRVRMRFAWWHLGVALLSIAFGGWLVLAMQPWRSAPGSAATVTGDR